jgi:hypothetical protein
MRLWAAFGRAVRGQRYRKAAVGAKELAGEVLLFIDFGIIVHGHRDDSTILQRVRG